jgi:hypothetical protein
MNEKAEKEGIIKSNLYYSYPFRFSFDTGEFANCQRHCRLRLRIKNHYYSLIRDWLFDLAIKQLWKALLFIRKLSQSLTNLLWRELSQFRSIPNSIAWDGIIDKRQRARIG